MVVEYSGGQEGYVKGSKEKGGELEGSWKVKKCMWKEKTGKTWKREGGRKERVNKREEKRVEKKRKFISSIWFVFEVSVLAMLSIKTLMYLHGKKSKRIWLLANSFYLLYTANYLSEFLFISLWKYLQIQ